MTTLPNRHLPKQVLRPPLADCKCEACGQVNWGRPDGSDIDLDSDWLNLNRVLMCLSCNNKGLIDASTHKRAAASVGVNVPDSFLQLGYSASDYLEAVKKRSGEA